MKVNHYECDICGAVIPNYQEFRIQIKYPVKDKIIDRVSRQQRAHKQIELCEKCFNKRLKEFLRKEENDHDGNQ